MANTKKKDVTATLARTVISICLNVLFVAIVAMVIFTSAGKGFEFGKAIFEDAAIDLPEQGKAVVVTIRDDYSSYDIAKAVEKAGLVEDKNVFFIQLILSEYKEDIKAGTYTASTAQRPSEIMQTLAGVVVEEDTKK